MSAADTVQYPSKEEIALSFGDAAEYYHRHARIQKEVAQRLIASLEPWRDIIPPGPVLEVGCGTGFVSGGLIDLYPNRQKIITDLSPEMVQFCKNRYGTGEKLEYRVLDAEQIAREEPHYALTVSGFAAQWFKDPPLTLGRLLDATLPGGLLLASFPGNESFPRWREYCRELGLPFTGNPLPDTEEMVIKMSSESSQVDYYEDTVSQTFDSAADFFRHLKKIGAGTRHKGRMLTPSEIKLLVKHWDEQAGGQITVSYQVIFLAVKKDLVS